MSPDVQLNKPRLQGRTDQRGQLCDESKIRPSFHYVARPATEAQERFNESHLLKATKRTNSQTSRVAAVAAMFSLCRSLIAADIKNATAPLHD